MRRNHSFSITGELIHRCVSEVFKLFATRCDGPNAESWDCRVNEFQMNNDAYKQFSQNLTISTG